MGGTFFKYQKKYQLAIKLYKYYIKYFDLITWSTTILTLKKWAANHLIDSTISK